ADSVAAVGAPHPAALAVPGPAARSLADPARLVGLVDSVDAVPVALAGLVGSARPPRSAGRRAAAYARRATRVHARDRATCPRPATTAAGLRRSEPPPAPGRFVGRGLRCRCRSAARGVQPVRRCGSRGLLRVAQLLFE